MDRQIDKQIDRQTHRCVECGQTVVVYTASEKLLGKLLEAVNRFNTYF